MAYTKKATNTKGRPAGIKDVVRKNVQIKYEHMQQLQAEADEKYEGNLSMLIRNIFDIYIEERGMYKVEPKFSD